MKTTDIAYEADGASMIGTLATPDNLTGKVPGILVCHEGPGLNDHARDIAKRLAEAGYVAFAMDYHGGGQALTDMGEAMKRIMAWMADPTGIRARATAALGVLKAQPGVDTGRLAAIGYCFGGTTSLELARQGEDLKAVVGFHSGLGTARPQDAGNIKGKVLVQIGADDPIIPPQQRLDFEKEMTAGGVDWRLLLYGGAGHSFTNPLVDQLGRAGFAYNKSADQRAWRAMIDLFDEAFA
ncbi:dienelactone hydrolase [Caulobacter ginsengisoli]|uniref:Dienelactone hydrolase n=1 Tax=Caulobacter ginsengisoli TaxID=400775 RepID=A0ABU0IXJ7_9CAUL|nr:dienelactone hydrolase family protein [Caulobacter ginsengisoli]MDQ0466066.1 dienelactone hydrolase [Caulobacter ginsengisoli]